jgi:hypothetical protein
MLAEDADVKPAFVLDVEYAKRQEAFRHRLIRSGVVVRHFRSLAELERRSRRVYGALGSNRPVSLEGWLYRGRPMRMNCQAAS